VDRVIGETRGLVLALAPDDAFEDAFELAGGTIERIGHRRGAVADGGGLAAFETGLHDALDVVGAALARVLVAQVHFDPGDLLAEAAEGAFDGGGGLADSASLPVMWRSVLVRICMTSLGIS
jgi:hypothetical protein